MTFGRPFGSRGGLGHWTFRLFPISFLKLVIDILNPHVLIVNFADDRICLGELALHGSNRTDGVRLLQFANFAEKSI